MIEYLEYVGKWASSPDLTEERKQNALLLLEACRKLEMEMLLDGVLFPNNPATGSGVSGTQYGGFRPQSCPEGAPRSAHKEGQAVDRYDPANAIDNWLLSHPDALVRHGIYIEHPDYSPKWSHWAVRAPGSGKHIFIP